MDVWLFGFHPTKFGIEVREWERIYGSVTCTFADINVWVIYGKFFIDFVQDIFLEDTHTLI